MAELDRVTIWANALIKLHLDPSWTFAFDHARTRFGACDHHKKRITISRHLAASADDDDVHQVLLHEVAHAIAGARAGHGAHWLRVARELGYEGGRTHNHAVAHDQARWLGVCPSGHELIRFRRPNRPTSCAQCHPRFHREFLIEWVDRRATA
jgi:predicted SprT family Zn-dependent metalloprotease